MKKIAKFVLPLMIVAVAISAFGYLRATRPLATPNPVREKVWAVSAVAAQYADVQPTITEFGTVVAGSVAELRPLVAGRIVELGPNFVEGAIVQKGEKLVVIDPFEYEIDVVDKRAAIAEGRARLKETRAELRTERQLLKIAEEQLELRKRDVERKRKLSERGTLSRKALDDAMIAFNDTKQSLEGHRQLSERLDARAEQLEAALTRTEAALKQAKRNLSETTLTAPEDGYLADALAAVGQRVGASDRLARLIVARRLEVSFQLTRRDFGHLAGDGGPGGAERLIGLPVLVNWRVGRKNFRLNAIIERLKAEIDTASGGIGVYARLIDRDVRTPLRPGAFVEVSLVGNLYRNVLRLPESAVGEDGTVYVVDKGRLAARRVTILRRVVKDVLVRAEIEPGTQIVTTRFPEIGPGLQVDVR